MSHAEMRSVAQLVGGDDMKAVKAFQDYCMRRWHIEALVVIGNHLSDGGLAVMECSARVLTSDQVEEVVLNAADYIALVKAQMAMQGDSYVV